jgi:hypothetical protein
MRSTWTQFFGAVNDLKANMTVESIKFEEGGALARLLVVMHYTGAGGSGDQHVWQMRLGQRSQNWLIADIER